MKQHAERQTWSRWFSQFAIRNSKFLFLSAVAVALLVPTVVAARIGETIEQCDTRYGTPTKVEAGDSFANSVERTYRKDGFTVQVLFVDGRAEKISYSQLAAFTDEQISKLLSNNTNGETWESAPNGNYDVYGSWETPGGATAEYFKLKPWELPASSQYCLEIHSRNLARLVAEREAEKRQQEEKKAEAANQKAKAAKQRQEREQRDRLKLFDKL
jgi:hypothetical protein